MKMNIIVLSVTQCKFHVPPSNKRFHIELKVLVDIVRWIRKLLQRVMLHNGGERAVRRCVIGMVNGGVNGLIMNTKPALDLV